MPTPYLSILAIIAAILASAILVYEIVKEGRREFVKYLVAGFLLAAFDFFIEWLGTSVNEWTYYQSAWFVFGLVPVELILLFFSGGVGARFIYRKSEKIPQIVSSNTMLYVLILLGFLAYTRDLYFLNIKSNVLYLAVPIGMWGIVNIQNEKNRVSALAIAATVAVVDALTESFFIRKGSYVYATGDFPWQVPLVYALFTIGLFGVMGKIELLDKFFDYPLIRAWLKIIGVRREMYERKVKSAVAKAKKKINGVMD